MTEIGTSGTAGTRAFCGECGEAVAADERFCSQCGHPLAGAEEPTVVIDPVPAAAGAVNGNGTTATGAAAPNGTATPPPGYTQPGYAPYATGAPVPPQMAGFPPQGPPIAYPAAAYPVPAPPQRTNTGLIIGLIAAGFAAVGLIVAVVLLATGNHSTSPTITTTNASAPAITPVSPSPGTTLATSGSKNAGKLKSSTPKPVVTPSAPAVSTPAPTPTPAGPTAADRAAAAQVVVDQWNLIGSENFYRCRAEMVPGDGLRLALKPSGGGADQRLEPVRRVPDDELRDGRDGAAQLADDVRLGRLHELERLLRRDQGRGSVVHASGQHQRHEMLSDPRR